MTINYQEIDIKIIIKIITIIIKIINNINNISINNILILMTL